MIRGFFTLLVFAVSFVLSFKRGGEKSAFSHAAPAFFHPGPSGLRPNITGTGIHNACEAKINKVLQDTSEYNKWGSTVATTIISLLPALLSFAPLPTANIRDLLYLSPTAACFTAAATLGLPVRTFSPLSKSRVISAKNLLSDGLTIAAYGIQPLSQGVMHQPIGMESLHRWYRPDAINNVLFQLQRKGFALSRNASIMKVVGLIFLFGCVQSVLFMMLFTYLRWIDSIYFIWMCEQASRWVYFGGIYIALLVPGIILTFLGSDFANKQEVFHLTPLSPEHAPASCEICSVTRKLTPSKGTKSRWWLLGYDGIKGIFDSEVRTQVRAKGSAWTQIFTKLSSRNPMVVVIRLSSEANPRTHPMLIMFDGIVKALILFILTFFFGSVYGGTLFKTTILVVFFFFAIALSRVLSVWIFCWLEKSMELRIIECESSAEMRGMARLLVAMPGVLVESKTHGYRYSGGYRVDGGTDGCGGHALRGPLATERSERLVINFICWFFAILACFLMFWIVVGMLQGQIMSEFTATFGILGGVLVAIELSSRLGGQVMENKENITENQGISDSSSRDIELEEVIVSDSREWSKNVSVGSCQYTEPDRDFDGR